MVAHITTGSDTFSDTMTSANLFPLAGWEDPWQPELEVGEHVGAQLRPRPVLRVVQDRLHPNPS